MGQGVQGVGGSAKVTYGRALGLECKPSEPPDGGALKAARIPVTENEAHPQRIIKADPRQLPGGGDDERLVAGGERPSEPAVGAAVARHERMFDHGPDGTRAAPENPAAPGPPRGSDRCCQS